MVDEAGGADVDDLVPILCIFTNLRKVFGVIFILKLWTKFHPETKGKNH
jgi:hypothetical protein